MERKVIDISIDFSGLEAISRDLELLSRAETTKVRVMPLELVQRF